MFEHVDLATIFNTVKFIATYHFKVLSVEERLRVQDRILELTKIHKIPFVNKSTLGLWGMEFITVHSRFVSICILENKDRCCVLSKTVEKGLITRQ